MVHSKILIADDESLNISLYTKILKDLNYTIIKASNGIDAVSLAETELPDLIIMDWNMPRMDGLEALKIIKQGNKTKKIPVIMITGIMTTSKNLSTALEAGAIDFLRKPFDKLEMQARVRSAILLSGTMKVLEQKYNQLEVSNKFIQSLIEKVPHPLVYYSLDGIILGCNQFFENLSGLPAQSLTGTMVYSFCSQQQTEIHRQKDLELISKKEGLSYENKMGNNKQEFIFSKNLFYNENNAPEGILCIMTDVTEIKKQHQELMENKKRELVSSALRLIQIGEVNNQLIVDLAKVNAYTNRQGSELIRKIISQNSINSNKVIWKDFEMHFEKVYEEFYTLLEKTFSDLTPGDKKLCALLRLNLSSKDIAAITFQKPQSVDMARYRLRKKLNLESDESLIDLLMKLKT